MVRNAFIFLLIVSLFGSASAQESRLQPTSSDWFCFRADQAACGSWADTLKDIPLGEASLTSLTFGGHLRERFESFDNFAFGAPENNDDDYLLHRLYLSASLKVDRSEVFLDFINATSSDRDLPGGDRPVDRDEADIVNAWVKFPVDMVGENTHLKMGRQAFAFGRQRLLSNLPWVNSYHRWDGLRLDSTPGGHKLSAFAATFVPKERYSFNDFDDDVRLGGLYLTSADNSLDAYALYTDRQQSDNRRVTIGARSWRPTAPGRFDTELEVAGQFGKDQGRDVAAWMLGSEIGYKGSTPFSPRLHFGLDVGSGDDNPEDGDLGTFDQLFPLAHLHLGYIDAVGRQNVIDVHQGLSLFHGENTRLAINHHLFWRAETEDALYAASGAPLRQAGGSDERFVGNELDLLLSHKIGPHLNFLLGYSRFWAGDFIEDTGAAENTDLAYLQTQFTF